MTSSCPRRLSSAPSGIKTGHAFAFSFLRIESMAAVEICTDAIHLINEGHARNAVFIGLTPDCLRLRLHAGDGIENCNRAVEHAQRTLDLRREIHVTRRVDDVHTHLDPS